MTSCHNIHYFLQRKANCLNPSYTYLRSNTDEKPVWERVHYSNRSLTRAHTHIVITGTEGTQFSELILISYHGNAYCLSLSYCPTSSEIKKWAKFKGWHIIWYHSRWVEGAISWECWLGSKALRPYTLSRRVTLDVIMHYIVMGATVFLVFLIINEEGKYSRRKSLHTKQCV